MRIRNRFVSAEDHSVRNSLRRPSPERSSVVDELQMLAGSHNVKESTSIQLHVHLAEVPARLAPEVTTREPTKGQGQNGKLRSGICLANPVSYLKCFCIHLYGNIDWACPQNLLRAEPHKS